MNLAFLLVLIALLQYLWFSSKVGLKRGEYGVKAPATIGNESWERLYRVQQNTLEQMIIFIPAVLAFAFYSGIWAMIPGGLYLIGRQVYSMGYLKDPSKRGPGMLMTLIANVVLILGALVGVIKALV
ncbi:MAG: MAPEG family protein [Gammaproteobacteria bacterium]|nr:MAPEG family protein [Gammaproteobacteria bacterium]NNC97191.1 MAPEG family protein [Gammaproteobacteria bacterium]NNM14499.1 MAPEG family protein [Gammaproteobacteria bacterium]